MTIVDAKPASRAWDAVKISPDDTVAVALDAVQGKVRVLSGKDIEVVGVATEVPAGHKLSLFDLPAGAEVRKYGNIIGVLSKPVRIGEHVHTHNLTSPRRDRARSAPGRDKA